jgi:uracil-DNA glycosylase
MKARAILPDSPAAQSYDADCRRCARLVAFLGDVAPGIPATFCRPVPPFGARDAALVIVGLAPGCTARTQAAGPFTGDHAGIILYQTLLRYGFAVAARRDRPRRRARAHRLPDHERGQMPAAGQQAACRPRSARATAFLAADLASVPDGGAILALGRVAHDATLAALSLKPSAFPFAHGARHELGRGIALFDSYHCSRYNTNTGGSRPRCSARCSIRSPHILGRGVASRAA